VTKAEEIDNIVAGTLISSKAETISSSTGRKLEDERDKK
jgi:hypothetical protein